MMKSYVIEFTTEQRELLEQVAETAAQIKTLMPPETHPDSDEYTKAVFVYAQDIETGSKALLDIERTITKNWLFTPP
jgi:hypothetical protein